jgi:acyl dehydratase
VGQDVAVTDWITITQEQVNQFAEATGDHQWIHVDPERAKKGPFGAPVAHGYLTLSLLAQFMQQTVTVDGATMGVNYGLNKVRFPAPCRWAADCAPTSSCWRPSRCSPTACR